MPVQLKTQRIFLRGVGTLLLSLVFLGTSGAATYEHCNALLSEGLKNIRHSSSEKDWRNFLFHKICRKTASGWQADLSVLDLGSLGIGSQSAESFCENQASESQARVAEFTYTSELAAGALSAWNECQRLASEQKIFIKPTFGEVFLDFTIWRGKGVRARLLSVNYTEHINSCNVSAEETRSRRPFSSGEQLNLPLNEGNLFVHCERKTEKLEDGTEVTPTAEVSVFVSQAPAMTVVLPEEVQRVPVPKLRQIQDELASLNGKIDRNVEQLRGNMAGWGNCVWREVGERSSHYARPDEIRFCQSGEFLVSIDIDSPGHIGSALCCRLK